MQRLLLALALTVLTTIASAHGYTIGSIEIAHPYATPTPPGARTGAGYLKEIVNKGNTADRLVAATSPAADHVEIHTMTMEGDVMRMRAVPALDLPVGARVAMAPGGGYHLMLVGVKAPFKLGDKIPVTLTFEHAGRVDVELNVQERGASDAMHEHKM